jgi:hypothetical protein
MLWRLFSCALHTNLGLLEDATADSCVGKCNSWIEGEGPVKVLRGRALEVSDDDHDTGSTVMVILFN